MKDFEEIEITNGFYYVQLFLCYEDSQNFYCCSYFDLSLSVSLSLSLLFFHITQTMSELRIQIWGCPTTWVYIRCFWLVSFCSYWERVREKGVKCEPFMWETEFLTLLSHPSQSIFTLISTVYKKHRTRRENKYQNLTKNYDYFYLHANNTTSWIKIYLSTWPYIK